MNTTQVEQVMYLSGYGGGAGIVEFRIGSLENGKWYRIKPDELLTIINSTNLQLTPELARKYEYLTVNKEQ